MADETLGNTTSGDQATQQMTQAAQSVQPTSDPQGTNGSPDVQAGAPNTPPQTPQQPQGASGDQSASQGQSDSQKPQGDLSKPAGVTPNGSPAPIPANHPAIQKASLIHSIAQTLAGGPRTSYAIDANTGKMTATRVPLSNRDIGLALATAALTGGLTGLTEKGPGAEGRAAAAGFNTVEQQQQQKDQEAQQQASQNYARQAAITSTNFQTHQNALRLSQMDLDYHKQFVDTAQPVLKNLSDVGAALESGVRESDLLSKYHVTKDMAVPDGYVQNGKNPDGSDHYENTYTVIDPNKKIELPEDTAKTLAELRVPGYYTMKDGKAVPVSFSGTAPIKAGLVVNGLAMAQSFQITEGQLNKQLSSLQDGDKDVSQFDANLKRAIAGGKMTIKGLQTIANYSNLPVDQAVAAMEKDKVDPAVIGQYRQLVPEDALQKAKEQRETSEANRKAGDARTNIVVGKNNYEDVLANPNDYPADKVAAARKFAQVSDSHDVSLAGRKSAAEAAAHVTAEFNTKNKLGISTSKSGSPSEDDAPLVDPKLAPLLQDPTNYNTPNGTNEKFLSALQQTDPGRAAIVKAYSDGMDLQSYYAAVKKFGGTLTAYLHAYDPTFNSSKMRAYDKTMQESGASGKLGKTNASASTALEHLGDLHDSYGLRSAVGQNGSYDNSLNQASMELSSMYANGNKPGESEIQHNREALDHPQNIAKGHEASEKAAKEAMDKIEENFNQYDKDLPQGIKRSRPLSVDAASAYQRMTGEQVDPRLINPAMKRRAPVSLNGRAAAPTKGDIQVHGGYFYNFDGHQYTKGSPVSQ